MEKTRILQIYRWMTVGTDLKTPNPPLLLYLGWEHFFPQVSVALQKQLYRYLLVDLLAISEDFAWGSSPDERSQHSSMTGRATKRSLWEISSLTKMSCALFCREKCTFGSSGEISPGGFVNLLNTELRASKRTQDGGGLLFFFFFCRLVGLLFACLFIYLFILASLLACF